VCITELQTPWAMDVLVSHSPLTMQFKQRLTLACPVSNHSHCICCALFEIGKEVSKLSSAGRAHRLHRGGQQLGVWYNAQAQAEDHALTGGTSPPDLCCVRELIENRPGIMPQRLFGNWLGTCKEAFTMAHAAVKCSHPLLYHINMQHFGTQM
jgi:hypothetical protein